MRFLYVEIIFLEKAVILYMYREFKTFGSWCNFMKDESVYSYVSQIGVGLV